MSDIAIDAQGQVWTSVSMQGGEVEIVQLDPATGQAKPVQQFEADWWGGLYVIDGTVWTLERRVEHAGVEGGTLTQIVPGTAAPVDVGGSFALPVTDGASLWTPFFGDDTAANLSSGIARVDPATGDVLDRWRTGSVGYDLAVGEDGGIWFLDGQRLRRLNPATGEIDVTTTVEGTPIFLTPASDGVWVETYEKEAWCIFPFVESGGTVERAAFVPPTHTENGTTVLPMTLTDGSQVVVAYPQPLRLAELGVVPQTLIHSAQSNECGWQPVIRLGSMDGVLYQGSGPVQLASDGDPAMWEGRRGGSPYLPRLRVRGMERERALRSRRPRWHGPLE